MSAEDENMTEGVALFLGEQPDGSFDLMVRLTVIHANPEQNFQMGAILRIPPEALARLDSSRDLPIVRLARRR